ncbi:MULTISPECIES: orotate phosphoribosyltransferase [Methanoculleus]|uniref:Orotate phosphoribosyltransferase n=2 Tax=Methanoculleus TaxID=45989 RepID=PYRE_METMJ|nr:MULTISPECIES: orotate phosphoribosyltransferase [Methanoculleus]A3CU84.1 RecName: Full=Orotate phosphoribosyltransferase; Short=OPRT; Short=OPRTase [Methanoculleus marisnigri JR1]ABN56934.1 orotate phosphoribosyltransferase [Methanoculleus marisnigri JR1]MCC7555924.1 orotate phosphoribosyltransferase [Methanoculleus marisnigri]UYU18358.1 orotate phosphoribosyltransferase [Methanoculleus submarinus]
MVNPIATLLLECGAIEFGEFVLASGARSSYYIDIKAATTNPAVLTEIGKTIAEGREFEMVAGVAVGAVPIAVAVSLASGRPYAVVRKEGKDHGKAGTIIGDVLGKNVLLVEDVTTSGGSALYGLEALRAAGAHVDQVVTVVDREAGAREALAEKGASLLALVRVSELLDG